MISIQSMKDKKNNIPKILFIGIVITGIVFYYDILLDLLILFLFLLASYSIGTLVKTTLGVKAQILVHVSIGMGIYGILMYLILLMGIGNKSLYICMLLLPIIIQRKRIILAFEKIKEIYKSLPVKSSCYLLSGSILIYILMGNTVIRWADALAKYLSVVTYAAENGAWKTNIIESIVYADQFSMYCSLATIGVALGADRFYVWIATVSMCMTLLLILEFAKVIYKGTNEILIIATFLTLPLFMRLGTDMCVDFTQVFFLLSAILCMADLNITSIWNNLQAICLLCSFSIFSKLTAAYIVLAIGIPVIVFLLIYIIRNKIPAHIFILKFFSSIMYLVSGIIVPAALGVYYMGSPVLPWLNGIFKSPYVAQGNFVDPFSNSVYGLNFRTLTNIVFHTSANIEMADGAVGIFLLGILLFPIGIALYRSAAYLFWTILCFIMFKFSTFFTYNLRYYIVILVLFLALVCITLSIICTKMFKNPVARSIAYMILLAVNVLPNFSWMKEMNYIPLSVNSGKCTYRNNAALLLSKYVPDGSWVYGIEQVYRGDWTGTLYGNTWYNFYLLRKMQEDNVTYEELLQGFDYVICGRGQSVVPDELGEIVRSADEPGAMLEKVAENEEAVLYKIKNIKPRELVSYTDLEPVEIKTDNYFACGWDDLASESYSISFDITNENDEPIMMMYQIIYNDENGIYLDVKNYFDTLDKGKHHIDIDIKGNNDAASAQFVLYTYETDKTVYLSDLSICINKDRSYINGLVEEYYKRVPLERKRAE